MASPESASLSTDVNLPVDLTNLPALVKAAGDGDRGYLLIPTGIKPLLGQHNERIFSGADGAHFTQTFKRHPKNGSALTVSNRRKTGDIEFRLPAKYPDDPTEGLCPEPEEAMEAYVSRDLEALEKPSEYLFVVHGYKKAVRESLGLPAITLACGERLLRSVEHLPGIQSEYLYVSSSGLTVSSAHTEDGWLDSGNIMYFGAPKLWTVIHPVSNNAFENLVLEMCKIKNPTCSQFIRHLEILIAPSVLKKHGIRFTVVRQMPGDLMLVLGGAYHYVVNEGPNVAGAINFCEQSWQFPPFYRDCGDTACAKCCKKAGCQYPLNPTRAKLSLTENSRPLDFAEKESSQLLNSGNQQLQANQNSEIGSTHSVTCPATTASGTDTAVNTIESDEPSGQTMAAGKLKAKSGKPSAQAGTASSGKKKSGTPRGPSAAGGMGGKRAERSSVSIPDLVGLEIDGRSKRRRVEPDNSGLSSRPEYNHNSDDESNEDDESTENRQACLMRFGTSWLSFYASIKARHGITDGGDDEKKLYKCLAAASSVGTQLVVHQIVSLQKKSSIPADITMPQQMYDFLKAGERLTAAMELLNRVACLYLAFWVDAAETALGSSSTNNQVTTTRLRSKTPAMQSMSLIRENAVDDDQALLRYDWTKIMKPKEISDATKGKRTATIVYDRIVEHLSRIDRSDKAFEEEKKRIRSAKRTGQELITLSEHMFPGESGVAFGSALLFPLGIVPSPLDKRVKISKTTFRDIQRDSFMTEVFAEAIKCLRPGIVDMAKDANKIYFSLVMGKESTVRQRLCAVAFGRFSYDAPEVLSCFRLAE